MKTSTEAPAEPAHAGSRWLTTPNLLSGFRLALVPVFLWLFAAGREEIAVAVFAVAAITDFLDGYIARRTGEITELGKVLDPLADRVAIVALAVALVARGALPVWLAVVVVARDLLVVAAFPLLERRRVERIPVNDVGKWGTGLLLAGLTGMLLAETAWRVASLAGGVGIALVGAGAGLYWLAGILYGREALARLRRMEVRP